MLQKLTLILLLVSTISESKLTVEINQELIPKEISGSKTDVEWDFHLSCAVTSDNQANVTVKWVKDDVEIDLKERFAFSDDGNIYNLTIKSVKEDDKGIYECVAKEGDQITSTRSSGLFGVSVPKKLKFTEGEDILIQCVTLGGPPEINWRFGEDQELSSENDRVALLPDQNETRNAILLISAANQNDTGVYTCVGNVAGKIIEKSCQVTVIDPYAALFPFLCICAEVAILIVLILAFENRYKKKMGVGNDVKK